MTTNTSEPLNLKACAAKDLKMVALAIVEVEEGNQIQDGDPQFEVSVEYDIFDQEAWERHSGKIPRGKAKCDCCGRDVKYVCLVEHKPSKRGAIVGRQCFATIAGLAESAFNEMSVALAQKAATSARRNNWLKANPQHAEIFQWARGSFSKIAKDIVEKLGRFGSISEKQAELLYKLKSDYEARLAQSKGKWPEKREVVEGVVKSVKESYDYNNKKCFKMLVELDNGLRVYGSVPSEWAGSNVCGDYCDIHVGDRVGFKATFEPSKDDPMFGFFKRPVMSQAPFNQEKVELYTKLVAQARAVGDALVAKSKSFEPECDRLHKVGLDNLYSKKMPHSEAFAEREAFYAANKVSKRRDAIDHMWKRISRREKLLYRAQKGAWVNVLAK